VRRRALRAGERVLGPELPGRLGLRIELASGLESGTKERLVLARHQISAQFINGDGGPLRRRGGEVYLGQLRRGVLRGSRHHQGVADPAGVAGEHTQKPRRLSCLLLVHFQTQARRVGQGNERGIAPLQGKANVALGRGQQRDRRGTQRAPQPMCRVSQTRTDLTG
jgi:hypothetical protein